MKSKNLITLGIGAVSGFLCGSVFVLGKIMESKCMTKALHDLLVDKMCGLLSTKTTYVKCINVKSCLFTTYNDAKEVYTYLVKLAKVYGMVTVNDYYEVSNCKDEYLLYENDQYGWDAKTIIDMEIVKTKYGYKIDIPPAERLPE